MNPFKISSLSAAALVAGFAIIPLSRAQAQEKPATTPSVSAPAPGGGGGDKGGQDRMEQFRQHMNEQLKERLKASDEEWSVIEPLLNNVQDKLRESLAGRFGGMMGGPGGPQRHHTDNNNNGGSAGGENARPEGQPQRPAGMPHGSPESMALMAALADDNSSVNDIKAKLQAVRDQHKKSAAELEQSREELRKVLNMRQEAVLVVAGMLD